MIYAVVKSRQTRAYRVVQLVQVQDREFGVTLDGAGKPGWQTYKSKAEAFKAARRFSKACVCSQYVDSRIREETPFAPMTSQLKMMEA